jgi:hypothetical protein
MRFRPEDSFLNAPCGPDKSPLSTLSLRSFVQYAGQQVEVVSPVLQYLAYFSIGLRDSRYDDLTIF